MKSNATHNAKTTQGNRSREQQLLCRPVYGYVLLFCYSSLAMFSVPSVRRFASRLVEKKVTRKQLTSRNEDVT